MAHNQENIIHKPRKSKFFIIGIVLLLCFSVTVSAKDKVTLTVDIGPPVYYESKNGDRFVARYGSLSDGTLHFVKLKMLDGKEYTLPQAISGSGARYTDDREIVWWEHHGTVRVDVRDADGKMVTKYSGLKEIQKKK